MASGSSDRTGSLSRVFDYGSDDLLSSYEDLGNHEASNAKHADRVIGSNSGRDFRESRMGRSALLSIHNQTEEYFQQDLMSTVEKTMKKYADNLLHFLEGISARLSQLELYCYDLERSIGEMRSDITCKNSEANSKLKSLEKHLQEVHRSLQILRDKQELADTQKELAKLQLVHQESSAASHSKHKEEGAAPPASDSNKYDSTPEVQNQQLALALPHQVNPSTSLPARSMDQHQPIPPSSQTPPQNVHAQTPPQTYYTQQNQLPNHPLQIQHHPQDQYLQADSRYQGPQLQVPQQATQPVSPHVSQPQKVHPFPQYQQQWPQQSPQQVQQKPSMQAQVSPQTPLVYPPYPPTQPANPLPETFSGSMPVPVPISGIPQSFVSKPEPVSYGYGGTTRPAVQQQPPQPQHNMQQQQLLQTHQNTFGAPVGDGIYPVSASLPTLIGRQGYMMYDGEGGRVPHQLPPQIPQGGYPPPTHMSSLQNPQPIRHPSPSQMLRSHPYNELIENVVSMGYGRDYVVSMIQRMEESGQPVDLNYLLDRLNGHSSSESQRAWSG